jgi:hypothetical protein
MRRKTVTFALLASVLNCVSPARAESDPLATSESRAEIAVHAFSIRAGYGIFGPTFSLSTITLQWVRIYWDLLRGAFAIGVTNGSFLGAVETSAGARFLFGAKNELRLGLGLAYGEMTNDAYGQRCRTMSDDPYATTAPPRTECIAGASQGMILPVEAYYLRRIGRHFSLQAGLLAHVSIADFRYRDPGADGYPLPDVAAFVGVVF